MNAGSLRHRILIYLPVVQTSDYGNEKIEYKYKTSCRCAVQHDPTSKILDMNAVVYRENKSILVYNHVDIQTDDKIVLNEKEYFIISMDDEPEKNRKTIVISQVKD